MTTTELKIRLYGDPCLTEASVPVDEVTAGERILIQSMIHTMYAHQGIGLAAPQVGINKRIFVTDIGEGPMAVINPEVVKKSGSAKMEEGCLSIPGVMVEIERPQKITVRYMDESNQEVTRELEDLMARVFLHETDHLDGRLIFDYAKPEERETLIEQYKKAVEEEKMS